MMNSEQRDQRIIQLIKTDESYRNYFFKNAKDIRWFYILKGENFFDIDQIPGPNKSDDGGYYFPGWKPLLYLEKIAEQLSINTHKNVLEDLVMILVQSSKKEIDNPHVWHDIIKIVSNLPNDSIPVELFDNIPNWLRSEFRNSLPSSEICQSLLPKFLHEKASKRDLKKAEVILKHVLTIEKKIDEEKKESYWRESKYKPIVDLYWLKHSLIEKNLIHLVGQKLSTDIIYLIANNLKKIIFDQIEGKNISNEFYFRFDVIEDALKVSYSSNKNSQLEEATSVIILKYENFEISELTENILTSLKEKKENIDKLEDNFNTFIKRLFIDHSVIWCNSIHKMDDRSISRSEIKMIHTYLLKELIYEKAISSKNEFEEVKNNFLSNDFRYPIFKRILLYVISKSWNDHKRFFWDMVKNGDQKGYFSNSFMSKELFYLLRENISHFSKKERQKLNNIIAKGPQGKREKQGKQDTKYWQLNWYSALKDDSEYNDKYKELSAELKLDSKHYETLGEIQTRIGSISPFTSDEILDMGISKLLKEVRNFKSGQSIDDPAMDGFGNSIQHAVAKEPQAFINELQLLIEAPFFCVYHILWGFQNAWSEKRIFDWGPLLDFCLKYIQTDSFQKNQLLIEDDRLNINNDLIIHQIGRLITEGTQKDDNAFDKKYLPIAEDLLKEIVPKLEAENAIEESNMDYPTYSLNSKAGKVLIALINYSLRFARLNFHKTHEGPKWDEELKRLYDSAIEKGIIDSFILLGFYFPQFIFMDKEWLYQKVHQFEILPNDKWEAFMGGYLFDYPTKNKEIYELMLPHYKRSISTGSPQDRFGYSSAVKHIAAFYLWEIESLDQDSLIDEVIKTGRPEDLNRLINFFWEVRDQISDEQLNKLRERILILWKRISKRVLESDAKEKEKVLSNISKFVKYFEKFDETIFELLKLSAPHVNYDFNVPFFLEELNRLKNYGKSESIALYVGEILQSMLKNFTPDFRESDIRDLMSYMYEFRDNKKIKDMADSICDEYARRGKEFLRVLYNENRS